MKIEIKIRNNKNSENSDKIAEISDKTSDKISEISEKFLKVSKLSEYVKIFDKSLKLNRYHG